MNEKLVTHCLKLHPIKESQIIHDTTTSMRQQYPVYSQKGYPGLLAYHLL